MNTTLELVERASAFCTSLRQGDGLRKDELELLKEAISRFCEEHANAESIPKEAARALVELIPIIDSAAALYSGDEAEEIRNASASLFDLILTEL
jgi:hypothetical protein